MALVSYIEFTFLHDKEGIRYNKNSLNSNKIVLKNQLKKIGSENKVDLVIGFANIKNLKKK